MTMIKRILLYGVAMMITGSLTGQTQSQSLVTGITDFVGLSGYPTSPHLVEAGPESFYWISGSSYSVVNHPDLSEVINDYANIFFIKYDLSCNLFLLYKNRTSILLLIS